MASGGAGLPSSLVDGEMLLQQAVRMRPHDMLPRVMLLRNLVGAGL